MQFNEIQRSYLILFSYGLVLAARNVVATGNTTNITTSFGNLNCGLAHFFTNQTYNCTIGTDCPFEIQSNTFVTPMLIQGQLYDEDKMLLSLPWDVQAAIYTTQPYNELCALPYICGPPKFGPPFLFNENNQWPNGASLTCPHNTDCGVVVTVPLWNIIGNQTGTSVTNHTEMVTARTTNTTTWTETTTFRNTTITFEKVYALTGNYSQSIGTGIYSGDRCPNHSEAPQEPSAYVCYLPDNQVHANSSIPACPAGPVYDPANPFPNGTVYLQS